MIRNDTETLCFNTGKKIFQKLPQVDEKSSLNKMWKMFLFTIAKPSPKRSLVKTFNID